MMRKFAIAGLVAGAALGSVLMAGPAQASDSSDQQYNQNLQGVPVQVCNANVGAAGGAVAPLSPPRTGGGTTGRPTERAAGRGGGELPAAGAALTADRPALGW